MTQPPRPSLYLFLAFLLPCLLLAQPTLAAPRKAQVQNPPLQNALVDHPSPYLALHGRDPVAWQEWNADTLARARRENKMLFVSVGYFACHWCHVMQRESFRDPAIAELLNRHFIPVKVDRELNGALDAALIGFAERFVGLAGWPLNVVVTPEGYPAYALLYTPAKDLKPLLERLSRTWTTSGEAFARAAREASPRPSGPPVRGEVSAPVADELAEAFLDAARQSADTLQGGFGNVAKFPRPAQLDLLIELQGMPQGTWAGDFLRLTLDRMAALGLRDHVNGGFFRYTVDPDWSTPHFEKMLYDNAQLALLYHKAATTLGRPEFRTMALDALTFMLDVLRTPEGGFMTSVSALDAKGREGGAYLWTPEALRKRLTREEYAIVRRVWGMDTPAAFKLGYLPMEKNPPKGNQRALLRGALAKLKAIDRARSAPVDDKIGAGLNGLALSALSRAGQGGPRSTRAARELYAYIAGELVVDGKLIKARAGQRVFPDAELDDYAYVVAGLRDYAEAFDEPAAGRLASSLARQAWMRHFGPDGWRREERPLLASIAPDAALEDGATPSPSAMLIAFGNAMNDAALKRQAAQALSMAVPVMRGAIFDHASGVAALRAATR